MNLDGGLSLHTLMREQLTGAMVAGGWVVDVAYDCTPGTMTVGAFRRPLANDFFATAEFLRSSFGRDPELRLTGAVGVSFEPAYRLWPTLINRERSEIMIGIGELLGQSEYFEVTVSDERGGPAAVQTLVAPIREHAVEWATNYADVDVLLAESRADREFSDWEIEVVPTLLAVTGRHDEARVALRAYETSGRNEVGTREYRRFSYQLSRWLDSGGVLPEPPTGPVGERLGVDVPARSFRDVRREMRGRREAAEAVRRARTGKGRDQLRQMLTADLDHRGIAHSPLQIETALDGMQASDVPLGRVRVGYRGVRGLVGAFRGIRKVWKEGVPATPEWLQPPARASYPVPTTFEDWIELVVDPAAHPWLDRVPEGAPIHWSDTVNVDAWLEWEPEPPAPASQVGVHIGAPRVALLDAAQAEVFRPALDAASRRGEDAVVRVRITQLHDPPRHLVEIASPKRV